MAGRSKSWERTIPAPIPPASNSSASALITGYPRAPRCRAGLARSWPSQLRPAPSPPHDFGVRASRNFQPHPIGTAYERAKRGRASVSRADREIAGRRTRSGFGEPTRGRRARTQGRSERCGQGDWSEGPRRARPACPDRRGRNSTSQAFYAGDIGIGESGIAGEFITLARVRKTQRRHGELAVDLHSDVPDRFRVGLKLFALAQDDSRRELQIEELWPHKGNLVLKFAGVDSISDAELLLGCELQVPRNERAQLGSGWNYVSDLIGCVVLDAGREIGKIEDVQFGAGEAPLLIVAAADERHQIPYAEAYLKSVDLEHKQIHMQLPEGMLDLNAPLTAEEKQQQGAGKTRRR